MMHVIGVCLLILECKNTFSMKTLCYTLCIHEPCVVCDLKIFTCIILFWKWKEYCWQYLMYFLTYNDDGEILVICYFSCLILIE